jgi:hypothetical protein
LMSPQSGVPNNHLHTQSLPDCQPCGNSCEKI